MNTSQIPLFFDSYEDAIRDTVTAIGGMKKAGSMLWPALPADDAGRKLAHCLNREHREKLSPGELALIRKAARQAGIHTMAAYEMREAGYADPQPIAPEDEAAQLQREFITAVKALESIQQRLARNGLQVAA